MMGRSQVAFAAITVILLHAGHATAQPYVPGQYPAPRCGQPQFEVLPEAEDAKPPNQAKASLYDYEVRQYDREVQAYDVCIRNYVAKANRDALRIRAEATKEAKRITDNANASVAMIRAQIRKAMANAKKISNTPASALAGK